MGRVLLCFVACVVLVNCQDPENPIQPADPPTIQPKSPVVEEAETETAKPERRNTVYCEEREHLVASFHVSAKTLNQSLPNNQLISCMECIADGLTFELIAGGLGHNSVSLKILKPCLFSIYGKAPVLPPVEETHCDPTSKVLYEADVGPNTVSNSSFSPDVIGCVECKTTTGFGHFTILAGGIRHHDISISFFDECHYKVFNGASVRSFSLIGLVVVVLMSVRNCVSL